MAFVSIFAAPAAYARERAMVQADLAAGTSVHQTVATTGVIEASTKRYHRQLAR